MAELTIHIKCSNGDKAEVKVESTATVLDLKEKITEKLQVPSSQQRLIYKGRVLKDDLTLESYEIQDGHTVHMVKSAGASTAASSAANNRPATTISAPPTTTIPAPTSTTTPPAAAFDPFGAGFGAGMNATNMQQQLLQNPEMMENLLNSPMMQGLLDNPDLLRNMILNNPQMQQVLNSNPQMRHVLNDPAVSALSLSTLLFLLILYSYLSHRSYDNLWK
jgi:ubiquilin